MKLERHSKIVELIGKYEIETQEELADYLNQAGFAVTQATVSRDIILRDGYMSMDMAQNILVITTVSGMAMAVAAALDALHFNEIVGCIAGDHTIMCAVRSADDTILVMDKLKKLIAG